MILIIGGAYQGKAAYAREHYGDGFRVLDHYHMTVREQLRQGLKPVEEARKLLAGGRADRLVIISDEIGCGIVPADAFEREFREQAGRVSCYLAQEAEQVIRVVCGIGMRIV